MLNIRGLIYVRGTVQRSFSSPATKYLSFFNSYPSTAITLEKVYSRPSVFYAFHAL
jgi:hypothetical protein